MDRGVRLKLVSGGAWHCRQPKKAAEADEAKSEAKSKDRARQEPNSNAPSAWARIFENG